jgi:hypothetical protein
VTVCNGEQEEGALLTEWRQLIHKKLHGRKSQEEMGQKKEPEGLGTQI